jgi:antitoxin MazE
VQAKIQRWGNSLALRIPKSFASEMGLAEKTDVNLAVVGETLVVSLIETELTLDDLLADLRPETIHGDIATGNPVGLEQW